MAKNCLIELQYDMEVEYFNEILEIRKLLMENMYLVTNFLAAAASRAAGTSIVLSDK